MKADEVDAALDKAREWSQRIYEPDVLALIRAAEAMREQLYGSHRDDADPMPVFVIKAKDEFAISAVAWYRRLCEARGLGEQAAQVRLATADMDGWRARNARLVQLPDHRHVP